MKLNKKSKRLGIYIFYDKDNIIDDYVIYMLKDLNKAVDNIIFVSNSKISKEEEKKLNGLNIEINIRENIGLDAGAFKYVYDKYKREYLCQYDEVLLLNDTFYGPFKPFKEIINEMNDKDIDFWGLTANFDSKDGTGKAIDKFIHSHVQTFFVAYRRSVLESTFFNKYWKKYNINKNNSFENVVNYHESYFTYLLEKNGFKWDTYVNLNHFKKDIIKYNYNIYGYSAYTLLKYYNCPFIKRKNFVFNKIDSLYINDGMDTKRALDYIKNNTNYDLRLIFNNLKRIYSSYDLYRGLSLNYLVEENKNKYNKKLIIANIEDLDSYLFSMPYFNNIKECDKLIFTSNTNVNKKYDIKYVDNLYKYINKNRKELMQKYDYICLLNLYDEVKCFQEVVDSKLSRLLDNTIKSDEYINGVIDILKDDFVDILFTPESIHNKNINNITGKYNNDIISKIENNNNIKLIGNSINKSFDGLWIKSSVLNKNINLNISYSEYLSIFELLYDNNYGRIYNKSYLENDILSFEEVYKYSMYNEKVEMSFPNKMFINSANPFRVLFRYIVPLNVRKRLKQILKIK